MKKGALKPDHLGPDMTSEKHKITACFSSRADQRLVSGYLGSLGYELIPCTGISEDPPSLFILDVPSARRFGNRILALKKTTDILLPMIVALGRNDTVDPWLAAGFDDCIRIPITKAELKNRVAILLRLREQSEILAQKSELKYQAIFENTGTATLLVDENTTILMANRECLPVTGYTPEELIGTKWTEYVAPESLEMMLEYHKARREEQRKAPTKYEARLINKNGDIRDAILDVGMVSGTGQSVVSMLDITELKRKGEELKRTVKELRESEKRLRTIIEAEPECVKVLAPDGSVLNMNRAGLEIIEADSPEQVLGDDIVMHVVPEHRHAFRKMLAEVMRGHSKKLVFEMVGLKGSHRWMETHSVPLRDANNEIRGILQITRDITKLKQAEAQGSLLLAAIEQAGEAVVITDDKGSIQYVNPAFEEITGYSKEEALGQNPRILKSGRQTDEFYRDLWTTITSGKTWRGRIINKRKDGSLYTEEATISSVRGAGGTIVNYIAIKRDMSEHIRLYEEKVRLERQLNQAQKMEAIGRLAGGVAHDFNNMLNVILGYSDIILKKLKQGDPLRKEVEQIMKAGRHSASLTSQLLAFSRKQTLQPKIVDLNVLVRNIQKMLHRLIGENIDLVLKLADDPWFVKVDPGQVEQIIMNLAVNARDAMPDGGKLVIETANTVFGEGEAQGPGVRPGEYVMLCVSDTGHGMDKETLSKIFEPFFTTKEIGQGSNPSLVPTGVREVNRTVCLQPITEPRVCSIFWQPMT